MMVSVPMALRLNTVSPARSRMPSSPPALFQVNGSSRKKTPIVFSTNCTMSVSVMDHMPPIAEYSMTTAPPMMTDSVRPVPNSTLNTVA